MDIDATRKGQSGPGAAYGERVAERLASCVWAGRLEDPDGVGEAGTVDCGSLVTIELAVDEGFIAGARYRAVGCPATLASASEVCSRAAGSRILEAAAISESQVCAALGLRPDKEYTAGIALDALHGALGSVLGAALSGAGAKDAKGWARPSETRGILVGMSGGVDSSVAALLLRDAGMDVVGITLRLWHEPGLAGESICCSPESVRRARRVAHQLGIPHLTLDATEMFRSRVVEYFVSEYAHGRTPNPCAKCNARLRLGLMLDAARRLGLDGIATGHYARMAGSPPCLARGEDVKKDQSYVLAEVPPDVLGDLVLPLSGMTKVEVRAIAARAGLEGCSLPESQEICFVPDDDHRRFLRDRLGDRPGEIVDQAGKVLGTHSGTYNFTVGQRRGLGLPAAEPWYVSRIDAVRRRVFVGSLADTAVRTVHVAGLTVHRAVLPHELSLQCRSSGPAVPVQRVEIDGDAMTVALAEPAYGVAPGQTAVVYAGAHVVAAGTIAGTEGSES